MDNLSKFILYLKWQIDALKKEYRIIYSLIEKIRSTPVFDLASMKKFFSSIDKARILLLSLEKEILIIMNSSFVSYKVFQKLYDLYFARSYIYLNNAYEIINVGKMHPLIHESLTCKEIYSKTFVMKVSYNNILTTFQGILKTI